ncbi:CBS domain-containing protein [Candidatus Pantoea multigeneris]|uniref:CBS domain-containing protein n=1 Tax=Candidatus Pantoea multigeneris TaxID=2608357 RepID=A0ABX0R8Y4_9GAMM|nr:CBS domain-containing protein [Pantoea multigeneris]NIF20598.1 CBS domain-containing protein [Pantoea multigeneris]
MAVENPEGLKKFLHELKEDTPSSPISVRDFISLFGAERRGYMVAYKIRKELENLGFITKPDFDSVPLDSKITIHAYQANDAIPHEADGCLDEAAESSNTELAALETGLLPQDQLISGAVSEPAFRVSRLEASDVTLVTVKPDATLTEAITLMLRHDYSQLPVMTSERDVKGVISWESIAPVLALTKSESAVVRNYMKPHREINASDSIFTALPRIIEYSYVLVRSPDQRISGIITTTDLSSQFKQLSEPFLLLSEIENHIRKLIDGKFTKDELVSIVNPSDSGRVIDSVADLTFGEYIRLFENPDLWKKTELQIDKKTFIKELDKVRIIRNDVMHFDPDGISEENHELLHNFVRFIHTIQSLSRK